MRNKRFPNYPDDTDYTTNAPSYYEDLARKEKLIRLLAERIWGYEKILDETLEEIQERFRAWDKNLEDFPENVKELLQLWMDNGTFDHIINETIFNWKLDTTIFEQFRDSVTTQLQLKANQSFVDSQLASIVSGAPKGTYTDLVTLQNTYPNGAEGVFLVLENGHWYYYASGWKDGGVYQAEGIDYNTFRFLFNNVASEKIEYYPSKSLDGASGENVTMSTKSGYTTIKLTNVPKKGKLRVNKTSLARGQFIVTTDSNDKFVNNFEYGYGTGTTTNYLIYPDGDKIVIDLYYLSRLSDKITNLYLSFVGISSSSIVTQLDKGYDIADVFKWVDMSKYLAYKNFGELLNEYQPVNKITNNNMRLEGYDTSNGNVQMGANNNYMVIQYQNIPTFGTMTIPKKSMEAGQFIVFTSGDKCVSNLNYKYADGTSSVYFITQSDEETIIDFGFIHSHFASLNVDGFYLCTIKDDNFYNDYNNIVNYEDVFGFIKLSENSTDYQFVYPEKIPKMTNKEMLVFLDNFVVNGNAYERNIISTSKSISQEPIAYIEQSDTSLKFNDKTIAIDNVSDKNGNAKVLVLGESTSDNSGVMGGIKNLTDGDSNLSVSYLGTRTVSGVPNEAFSGWGIGTLRYAQTANGFNNPFYNPATNQFDYAYYLSQTSQAIPDIVFINFGINDVNRYTDKSTSMTDTYDFIINQIKTKNANCKFIIGLTHSYSRYGNYKDNAQRQVIINRVKDLQTYYTGKESNGIYLAPYYATVDPLLDRPSKNINGYVVGTDPVHLTSDGYRRGMVDMMYVMIKKVI